MKDRIYVCHTFYHVLITFLKEFELRARDDRDKGATLVLSLMSNNFGGLKDRIEELGFFEEVIEFDEKRESFFPELAELKKDRGNIVSNMIQRIKFTSAFAKAQEPFVPVDFGEYRDVYVYCDTDPIGLYLNKHKIRYHAIEDGLDCLKTLDLARISNAGHFKLETVFASLNLIFIENGYSKYCIDMEINDRSVLQYDYKKYKVVPRKPLYDRLTQADKEILLSAFVENKSEIEKIAEELKMSGSRAVLILSDPLTDLETRKKIMQDLIETYGRNKEGSRSIVFIKPHPRDVLDYRTEFPDYPQISPTVPMELLGFFENLHFDTVVSVYTELGAITFADEKIRLGHDFMDKYEPVDMHRHKI